MAEQKKRAEDYEAAYKIRAHLRRERRDRKLTKEALAELLGTDGGNLGRLLSGERISFTAGMVLQISRKLGVNPSLLLEGDPPAKYVDEAYVEEEEREGSPASRLAAEPTSTYRAKRPTKKK